MCAIMRTIFLFLSILNQHASTSVPQATSTDSGTCTTLTGIFQHTSADDHEMLPPRMTTQCLTDVGTASKKGARGKVVEDLRRQILLAFWVVEELPTTFSRPGHALPLTYNHATYGGPCRLAFCHREIKGRDTGSPKRANCLHLAAA